MPMTSLTRLAIIVAITIVASSASAREDGSRAVAVPAQQASDHETPAARVQRLLDEGRTREALAELDVLLAQQPDPAWHGLRGFARVMLNAPNEAIADFDVALKKSPYRSDLLTGRATAYELIGNDDAALRDYETILGAVGSPPNIIMQGDKLARYHFYRARIFQRQKRFTDAAADAAQALTYGGRRAILRAQVFLRQQGFSDVTVDGQDSSGLRSALQACFVQSECAGQISKSL